MSDDSDAYANYGEFSDSFGGSRSPIRRSTDSYEVQKRQNQRESSEDAERREYERLKKKYGN